MSERSAGRPLVAVVAGPTATILNRVGVSPGEQSFYPDARELYSHIDEWGMDQDGRINSLSRLADFVFLRAAPPGGYPLGHPETGEKEILGRDYFPYSSCDDQRAEPSASALLTITNTIMSHLRESPNTGGIQWLEGSTGIEETLYWLNLTIDTEIPIVGQCAYDPSFSLSSDGPRHLLDGLRYIASGDWRDGEGKDRMGAVLVIDGLVLSGRTAVKTASRPGGFAQSGGGRGRLGVVQGDEDVRVELVPVRKHTYLSRVRISKSRSSVMGVRGSGSDVRPIDVPIVENGRLQQGSVPAVEILKHARYSAYAESPTYGNDIERFRLRNLKQFPLAGFVNEGFVANGMSDKLVDERLRQCVLSGFPVVKCGRGIPDSYVRVSDPLFIGGNDLTANKARILLMACLMKFGGIPPAANPEKPNNEEFRRAVAQVVRYQELFDTH